jgi:tripartite-type tricarboxylate transporter receptor subunit TctC
VDLLGGQIDSAMDQTSSSLPQIKAGKLRALAVATKARIADLPQVPTLQEQGLANFEAVTPSGLFAPAKTPAAIVKTLNAAVNKALADPAVKQKLADLGSIVTPMTSEQFDRFLREEEVKLKALVKSGVLKSD